MTPSSPKKRKKHRMLANLLIGFSISFVALWWIIRSVEKEEIFHQIKSVEPLHLGLAAFFTSVSYLLRAWRWPEFFKYNPITFSASVRCLNIGFFMNNILPARLGEFVRAHLGAKATNQTRTPVLATIAGERLADGVMISLLFATLFTFGANQQEISQGIEVYFVACLFGLAAVGTAILIYTRHLAYKLLEALGRTFSGHLSNYTLVRARQFIDALEPLLQPTRLMRITISSLIVWSVELLAYHQVSLAFNQSMTIGALSLFLAAVNFSSLIPAAPGGIGVIEVFATVALVHIGLDRATALAMVASQHIIQFLVVGIPGTFFFVVHLHGKLPEDTEDETEIN